MEEKIAALYAEKARHHEILRQRLEEVDCVSQMEFQADLKSKLYSYLSLSFVVQICTLQQDECLKTTNDKYSHI